MTRQPAPPWLEIASLVAHLVDLESLGIQTALAMPPIVKMTIPALMTMVKMTVNAKMQTEHNDDDDDDDANDADVCHGGDHGER